MMVVNKLLKRSILFRHSHKVSNICIMFIRIFIIICVMCYFFIATNNMIVIKFILIADNEYRGPVKLFTNLDI